jgi:hypothetical protein
LGLAILGVGGVWLVVFRRQIFLGRWWHPVPAVAQADAVDDGSKAGQQAQEAFRVTGVQTDRHEEMRTGRQAGMRKERRANTQAGRKVCLVT